MKFKTFKGYKCYNEGSKDYKEFKENDLIEVKYCDNEYKGRFIDIVWATAKRDAYLKLDISSQYNSEIKELTLNYIQNIELLKKI